MCFGGGEGKKKITKEVGWGKKGGKIVVCQKSSYRTETKKNPFVTA